MKLLSYLWMVLCLLLLVSCNSKITRRRRLLAESEGAGPYLITAINSNGYYTKSSQIIFNGKSVYKRDSIDGDIRYLFYVGGSYGWVIDSKIDSNNAGGLSNCNEVDLYACNWFNLCIKISTPDTVNHNGIYKSNGERFNDKPVFERQSVNIGYDFLKSQISYSTSNEAMYLYYSTYPGWGWIFYHKLDNGNTYGYYLEINPIDKFKCSRTDKVSCSSDYQSFTN
eukprot:391359_1